MGGAGAGVGNPSPSKGESGGVARPAMPRGKAARPTGPRLSVGQGSPRALLPHSGTRPPAPQHINVPLMKLFWLIYQINTNGTGC